jgi:hypothetical protein
VLSIQHVVLAIQDVSYNDQLVGLESLNALRAEVLTKPSRSDLMTWNLRRLRVGSSVVAGSLVLLLASGFLFQFLATERERRAFPPVGRLVDAGGYRLHLYCLGTGDPAVVFESGFGMSLNAWALVQPAVATLTRACSYDRPGYGWSDKPSNPRTDIRAAEDLHRALGHSMGGGQVRLFASRYPTEVAGLVIVASGHEDWRTRNPSAPPEDESMDHLFQAIAWLSSNWSASPVRNAFPAVNGRGLCC